MRPQRWFFTIPPPDQELQIQDPSARQPPIAFSETSIDRSAATGSFPNIKERRATVIQRSLGWGAAVFPGYAPSRVRLRAW